MQDQINFIINNINLSKEDKINLLKELFLINTKITFTDFDDTITNNNNIYYSKVKFYKNNNLFFHKIISDFSINNNFLNIIKQYNIKNLIILTRNSQEFINFFIENTKDYFDSIGVNIIGGIGYSDNFNINSFDKINIVPIKSFLVSDIYEFVYFRKHINFLCVDKFSFVRLINISLIKLFYFLMFILFYLMNNFLLHFIKSLRPKQSIKNIIIFIPILFSGSFFNYELLKISTLGFILFSFFVGLLYILNDVKDIDFDKIHPIKKFRPIASGDLNIKLGVYFSLLFMLIILILVYLIFGKIILYFFLIYFLNSLLYTIYLKNIVIVDVFFISFGFIIRGLIGIFLINSSISIWFLLILFLGSLFFGFLKRYQELQLDIISRKNIVLYNSDFLKQIISILTTLIIISYTFYTFNGVQSDLFFITVPFVLFGIIRYLYNIFYLENNLCGIDEIIYKDKFILLDIIIYFFIVFIIIYL